MEHLLCQVGAKSVVCGVAFGPDDRPLHVMLLLSAFCIRRRSLKVVGPLTQSAATSSRAESVSYRLTVTQTFCCNPRSYTVAWAEEQGWALAESVIWMHFYVLWGLYCAEEQVKRKLSACSGGEDGGEGSPPAGGLRKTLILPPHAARKYWVTVILHL